MAIVGVIDPAQETFEQRRIRIANSLINVKSSPAGFKATSIQAAQAYAYHNLVPYPWYHFREWKQVERGPYPKCLPFGKSAVLRGARWLFGKPIQINIADKPDLQQYIRDAWTQNKMRSKMRAAAEKAGVQGGVALKFSYDGTAPVKLRFQVLSIVDECRCFYDPLDRDELLMVRVQFPYFDAIRNEWLIYREEWTQELEVHYDPIPCKWVAPSDNGLKFPHIAVSEDGGLPPDSFDKWHESFRRPNPFGLIPIQPIRNLDVDDAWGIGDLWGLYRVWDRVNLTYHLMDRSNQFDSEPNLIFTDVEIAQDDVDRPLAPHENLSLKSDTDEDGAPMKGSVQLLEAKGSLRPAMLEYAKDLRKQILTAASSVEVDQAEFTNKGNLTTGVLTQLYGPLIEITEEKRENYGQNGICLFLERVAVGLKNLSDSNYPGSIPETLSLDSDDPLSYDVQIGWASYFELTQDELTAAVARTQEEELAGYLPHDRAIKIVASLEGIDDVDALQEDLKKQPPPKLASLTAVSAASAPPLQQMEGEIKGLKGIAGKEGA